MKRNLPGLRLTRNNTPAGVCIGCQGPTKRKSMNPEAVRKRRGRSDYFDICAKPECRKVRLKLWYRDNPREAKS